MTALSKLPPNAQACMNLLTPRLSNETLNIHIGLGPLAIPSIQSTKATPMHKHNPHGQSNNSLYKRVTTRKEDQRKGYTSPRLQYSLWFVLLFVGCASCLNPLQLIFQNY